MFYRHSVNHSITDRYKKVGKTNHWKKSKRVAKVDVTNFKWMFDMRLIDRLTAYHYEKIAITSSCKSEWEGFESQRL